MEVPTVMVDARAAQHDASDLYPPRVAYSSRPPLSWLECVELIVN